MPWWGEGAELAVKVSSPGLSFGSGCPYLLLCTRRIRAGAGGMVMMVKTHFLVTGAAKEMLAAKNTALP